MASNIILDYFHQNKEYQTLIVNPMFMIVQSLRSFLTTVTPTAIISTALAHRRRKKKNSMNSAEFNCLKDFPPNWSIFPLILYPSTCKYKITSKI